MKSISKKTFDDCCSISLDASGDEALKALIELGSFAPWCLKPSVRKAAESEREVSAADASVLNDYDSLWPPVLPQTSGGTWIPIVVSQLTGQHVKEAWPALRPAFPFPVRWQKDQLHDKRLPPALPQLADDVLEYCRTQDVAGQPHGESEADESGDPTTIAEQLQSVWGLQLPEECRLFDVEFSQLELSPDSAWVPLYAGLITGCLDQEPNTRVWSTGAKVGNEIGAVTGIVQKAQAAAEFGADRFYVPSSNLDEARTAELQRQLEIIGMQPHQTKRQQGNSLLLDFGKLAEPPESATADECYAWFLDPEISNFNAHDFYRRRVIPHQVTQFHEEGLGDSVANAHYLIVFVSNRTETVHLTAQFCQPNTRLDGILLFYTGPDMLRFAEELTLQLTDNGLATDKRMAATQIQKSPIAGPEEIRKCRTQIRNWMKERQIPAEQIILDVTPGQKWMTMALTACAPPGSQILYWCNESRTEDFRVHPDMSRPWVWSAEEVRFEA